MSFPNTFRFALSATAAFSIPAYGASPNAIVDLQEMVVTATRTERPLDATPGTVTAINLSDAGAITLNEMIRDQALVSVPFAFSGAGVAYQRGGANSVNIRGVEGNRVLLQVDGVRVPDEFRLGGSEPTGRDFFDPELFKRVEILQGSASALYGSDALGGVVTVSTKSPNDYLSTSHPLHLGAKSTYRSVDDGWSHAATAAAFGKFQSLLVYSRRDGHETENHGAIAPNPETYSSDGVLAKLAFIPTATHRFELALENFDRDVLTQVNNKEVTAGTATTTGLSLQSQTQRFRLSAAYRFEGDAVWFDRFEATLYFQDATSIDRAHEEIRYNPASAANGAFRTRDITTAFNNDTQGFALNAVKSTSGQRFAYGLEGSRTESDKPWRSVVNNAFGTTFPNEPRMAVTQTDRLGAYLQDELEWKLGDRVLTLIPAVRIDHFRLTPDNSPAYLAVTAGQRAPSFNEIATTPKLSAVFGLTTKLNAYAQYNRGFRYPTAEDLTATFTNPTTRYRTVPNPNLKEETSDAFEVGLKGHPLTGLTVRIALFDTQYKDFIEQIAMAPTALQDFVNWPSGTFQTQNRAGARIHGAELWARFALGERWPELRGFSVTGSVGKATGNYDVAGVRTRLTSVEPLKAFAAFSYDAPAGRFGGSFSVAHAASGQPGTGTQFTTPDYTVLDSSAYVRVHRRLLLRASLENLTDQKFWRYASVRGVTTTSVAEQERRTEPGFHATLSAQLTY